VSIAAATYRTRPIRRIYVLREREAAQKQERTSFYGEGLKEEAERVARTNRFKQNKKKSQGNKKIKKNGQKRRVLIHLRPHESQMETNPMTYTITYRISVHHPLIFNLITHDVLYLRLYCKCTSTTFDAKKFFCLFSFLWGCSMNEKGESFDVGSNQGKQGIWKRNVNLCIVFPASRIITSDCCLPERRWAGRFNMMPRLTRRCSFAFPIPKRERKKTIGIYEKENVEGYS
jgi:hypothetical protein